MLRPLRGAVCRIAAHSDTPRRCHVRGVSNDPDTAFEAAKRSLQELGMTEEEAEVEAAWDPADVDPESAKFTFDDTYSIVGDVPDDMRAQLSQPCYGPPALLVAGFLADEYAMIRHLLDTVQAQHVKVIVCDQRLLCSTVDEASREPEIDWTVPKPKTPSTPAGWGAQRVCLFCGLSTAQQATIVELLESEANISRVAVGGASEGMAGKTLGAVFAAAALEFRQSRHRRATTAPWARGINPKHVADSDELPDLQDVMGDAVKATVKEMESRAEAAESADDLELTPAMSPHDTDAAEPGRDLLTLDDEGAPDLTTAAASDATAVTPKYSQAVPQGKRVHPVQHDGFVTGRPSSAGGADGEPGASLASVAEPSDRLERQSSHTETSSGTEVGGSATPARSALAVDDDPERAQGARAQALENVSDSLALGPASGEAEAAASTMRSTAGGTASGGCETSASGLSGASLLDRVVEGGGPAFEQDTDRWLQKESIGMPASAGVGAAAAPWRPRAGGAGARPAARADEGETDQQMINRAASEADAMHDFITRALKSGVSPETLKSYIDEVAAALGPAQGEWVERNSGADDRYGRNGAFSAQLRGSQGGVLTYGPEREPLTDWDMKEDVRAERAAQHATMARKAPRPVQRDKGVTRAGASRIASDLLKHDLRLRPDSPYPMRDGIGSIGARAGGLDSDVGGGAVAGSAGVSVSGQESSMEMPAAGASEAIRLEGFEDVEDMTLQARRMVQERERSRENAPRFREVDRGADAAKSGGTISMAQLESVASRHGLDLDVLVKDAQSKGVEITADGSDNERIDH